MDNNIKHNKSYSYNLLKNRIYHSPFADEGLNRKRLGRNKIL